MTMIVYELWQAWSPDPICGHLRVAIRADLIGTPDCEGRPIKPAHYFVFGSTNVRRVGFVRVDGDVDLIGDGFTVADVEPLPDDAGLLADDGDTDDLST